MSDVLERWAILAAVPVDSPVFEEPHYPLAMIPCIRSRFVPASPFLGSEEP